MINSILFIGNAIIDLIYNADDAFLAQHDLQKGIMKLLDKPLDEAVITNIINNNHAQIVPGGSAINTATMLNQIGFSNNGLYSRIGKDYFGQLFEQHLKNNNIDYHVQYSEQEKTAYSLIIVTPDCERTMQTYLGASAKINKNIINTADINKYDALYIEGYLIYQPETWQAVLTAADIFNKNNKQIIISLSDPLCVANNQKMFQNFIEKYATLLLCNQQEANNLCSESDNQKRDQYFRDNTNVTVITQGKAGCQLITKDKNMQFNLTDCDQNMVLDATGAGDAYAAGFLYGYTQNINVEKCCIIGNNVGYECVCNVGARINSDKINEKIKNLF